ncbi:hypothetical protein JCM8097_007005 [Rhodosporidiobolus ruineniae]
MSTDKPTTAVSYPFAPPPPAPSASWSSHLRLVVQLLLGFLVVQHLHWPSLAALPRIQPCRYPSAPGEPVVYGFRVVSSPSSSRKWAVEVGKIPDETLKGRVATSYVGLTDNWLYLRVSDGDETHLVLASLFLANLITRDEAEAILLQGPARNLSLSSYIHRFPSFASLGAAYYAGSTIGTRKLLGSRASDGVIAPVLVGSASAGGVALLSSQSTAFSGGQTLPALGEKRSMKPLLESGEMQAAGVGGGGAEPCDYVVRLLLEAREEEGRDLKDVEPLSFKACQELAVFRSAGSSSFTGSSSPASLERFDEAVVLLRGRTE